MMSLADIERINRQATRRSQAERKVPALIEAYDVRAYRDGDKNAVSIPMIGDRLPRGYKKVGEPVFCDHSGFGEESEPAMTLRAFLAYLESHAPSYWGIFESGQFQSYVQEYEKVGRS